MIFVFNVMINMICLTETIKFYGIFFNIAELVQQYSNIFSASQVENFAGLVTHQQ